MISLDLLSSPRICLSHLSPAFLIPFCCVPVSFFLSWSCPLSFPIHSSPLTILSYFHFPLYHFYGLPSIPNSSSVFLSQFFSISTTLMFMFRPSCFFFMPYHFLLPPISLHCSMKSFSFILSFTLYLFQLVLFLYPPFSLASMPHFLSPLPTLSLIHI